MQRMICDDDDGPCAYHADGAAVTEKCPGICDAITCDDLATIDVDDGRFCAFHGTPSKRKRGRPRAKTARGPVTSIRAPSLEAHENLKARALEAGLSAGELAKRLVFPEGGT